MDSTDRRDPFFANKFLFVAVLFLVLMGLAYGATAWCGWNDTRRAAQGHAPIAGAHADDELPVGAALPYTEPLCRERFTLWAALLLVIPAFAFAILRRPAQTSSYWLLFWTFGFLAYLVHWCWAYAVPGWTDWYAWLHGDAPSHLTPGGMIWQGLTVVLALWWALDLVLAWASVAAPLERGLLEIAVFVYFLAACLFQVGGGVSVLLGIALILVVLGSFAVKIVTRRGDPQSLSMRLYRSGFLVMNGLGLPWYRLPTFLGVMNLGVLRDVLRAKNLVGTEDVPVTNPAGRDNPPKDPTGTQLRERNDDGYYNDLRPAKYEMGSASTNSKDPAVPADFDRSNPGARFGRNVPPQATYPDEARLLDPNPREISRCLLARTEFQPAGILNFLAAAWIQFQTHDWFFHGNPIVGNELQVPLDAQDAWDPPRREMLVRRTRPDPTRDYAAEARRVGAGKPPPPTYANAGTHWWDASQIYGDDPSTTRRLRTRPGESEPLPHGKMYLDKGLLPLDPADPNNPLELTGFNGNWWLGLTLLHTLFVREHNAICDQLHEEYPHWDGERTFQTARLVNAALMAKIHTVEWTCAILPNPVLQVGMKANWWGLATEPIKKVFGRISENEAFSGIMGSFPNHHAADYALTEEFVSVYRMHPLIRDDLTVYSATTGDQLDAFPIGQVLGADARRRGFRNATITDLFYSFGTCPPGALVLRNFPNLLRDFKRPDGDRVDLATIDVLRDRERGVPRYNDFRHWFHLPRLRSLDQMIGESRQLSETPDLAAELRRIYQNDVNRVDLMVGLFAETPPPLFGFSDTAFRVFILMASRRLKSDRFFTTDFTPEMYSPAGFAWVNDNNMRTVLLRHCPGLAPALRGVDNAFAPWKPIAESRKYYPYEPELDAVPK